MKILGGIPSILMPNIRMDSVLNMHVAIPLINADDFIMYGKSIIMEETGVLNDNICTNMLFAVEAVYSEEMNTHGFRDFWLPSAREQFLDISALVGRQIWDPAGLFNPLSRLAFPLHISDIIWRRDFSDNGEGSRVYYGVYPDDNTIPMHNFLTGKSMDTGHGYVPELMKDLGGVSYPEKDRWKIDGNRGYHVFYYYEPLPSLGIRGDLDDPSYYREFQKRCDPEIYEWIKGLMSGLMIYSADTVAAVQDMACISDLENKPDESAFPDGDVFTSGDRAPIKRLCASLGLLPKAVLVPHKKIWTAAQFEKYLPDEVKRILEDAVLSEKEGCAGADGGMNRIALDSMAAGRLAGLDREHRKFGTAGHPAGIPSDKLVEQASENQVEKRKSAVKKYRGKIIADITRDGIWNLSEEKPGGTKMFDLPSLVTGKNGRVKQAVSGPLFPRLSPTPEQIAEKERGLCDRQEYADKELLLENAFIEDTEEQTETDSIPGERLLEKAFMESGEALKQKSSEISLFPQDRVVKKPPDDLLKLKLEAEKTGDISRLLDSAFLEGGIE